MTGVHKRTMLRKPMDTQLIRGDHPQFSVVIPTYNRADQVRNAIDSALRQTYAAAEIIVVDDGSRDSTRVRLEAYAQRVRYLHQDNAGAASARNRGAREARHPWLAFLDSDDVWLPDYLEHMAGAISGTAGAAVLYFSDADFERSPAPKNRWTRAGFDAHAPFELFEKPLAIVFAESQPMLLPFSVFNRSMFLDAGGLWERLPAAEDTHLYVRLGLLYPMCAVAFRGGTVNGGPEDAGRLTGVFGPSTVRRWDCSVLLWRDILQRTPDLPPSYRQLLTTRIAGAYWRKALLCAKNFRLLAAAKAMGFSLVHDPSVASHAATRRLFDSRS